MLSLPINTAEYINKIHKINPELTYKESGFFAITNKEDDIEEFVNLKKRIFDKEIDSKDKKKFIDTNCYEFVNNTWKIKTKNCDTSYKNEVILGGTMEYLENMFYKNNEFNKSSLEKGIDVEIDLEGFSISIIKWSLVKPGRLFLKLYPFEINKIYVKNPPNYIMKLNYLAKKIFHKEAYEKIVFD